MSDERSVAVAEPAEGEIGPIGPITDGLAARVRALVDEFGAAAVVRVIAERVDPHGWPRGRRVRPRGRDGGAVSAIRGGTGAPTAVRTGHGPKPPTAQGQDPIARRRRQDPRTGPAAAEVAPASRTEAGRILRPNSNGFQPRPTLFSHLDLHPLPLRADTQCESDLEIAAPPPPCAHGDLLALVQPRAHNPDPIRSSCLESGGIV
jgi:hypothetical protein